MSELRSFLFNLSTAEATLLFCTAMGVVTALVGSVGGSRGPDPLLIVSAVAIWIILGIIFGGSMVCRHIITLANLAHCTFNS